MTPKPGNPCREEYSPFVQHNIKQEPPQIQIQRVDEVSIRKNMAATVVLTFHVKCHDVNVANNVMMVLTEWNINTQLQTYHMPQGTIPLPLQIIQVFAETTAQKESGPMSVEGEVMNPDNTLKISNYDISLRRKWRRRGGSPPVPLAPHAPSP